MVVTTCALEEKQHRALRLAAVEEGTVLTELIRRAVEEWLDRRERRRRRR
jgi:hypothetical protein